MKIAVIVAALLPAVASADFAHCLIDKLPGTENDVAANAIMQICTAEHPGGMPMVEQGSGRGWLSYKSGAECTMKKAGETRSNRAAGLIRWACIRLYDEPVPDWENGIITPPSR